MERLTKGQRLKLEKGEPISSYMISKLRNQNYTDALKLNASNIVKLMQAGKDITDVDLKEALAYFPDEATAWIEAGGKARETLSLGEWATIYAIAKHIGVSEQSLRQMIKRNPCDAPQPNERGQYNVQQLKHWHSQRSYNTTRDNKDTKQQILEQEYRIKKVKADREEELVIDKSVVESVLADADMTLEAVLKDFVKEIASDEEKQQHYLEKAKMQFDRWRAFICRISQP